MVTLGQTNGGCKIKRWPVMETLSTVFQLSDGFNVHSPTSSRLIVSVMGGTRHD